MGVTCNIETKYMRTLLRRGSRTAAPETLRLADLELDPMRRRVTRAGKRIDLTAKEFALLSVLARRQGEVLSKTAIAELVWDMNFDSNANVVEVAIKRLRAKIDGPYETNLLHTVRGVGWALRP